MPALRTAAYTRVSPGIERGRQLGGLLAVSELNVGRVIEVTKKVIEDGFGSLKDRTPFSDGMVKPGQDVANLAFEDVEPEAASDLIEVGIGESFNLVGLNVGHGRHPLCFVEAAPRRLMDTGVRRSIR